MHSDPELMERVQRLAEAHGLQRKHMFGGVCWFREGNLVCGIWHANLILRLGEDAALAAMDRDHVVPFDITGRAMRAWVMVEPAGCDTSAKLRRWVGLALDFSQSLPSKA